MIYETQYKITTAKIESERVKQNSIDSAKQTIKEAIEKIENDREHLMQKSEKELLVDTIMGLRGYSTRLDRIEKEVIKMRVGRHSDDVFVCNILTKKFHRLGCESVEEISAANKVYSFESAENLISNGYSPCMICKPQDW